MDDRRPAAFGRRPSVRRFYRSMAGAVVIGGGCVAVGKHLAAGDVAPGRAVRWRLVASRRPSRAGPASRPEFAGRASAGRGRRALRLIARRTWRFFETFVTADDHMSAAGQLPGRPPRRSSPIARRRPTSGSTCSPSSARGISAGSGRSTRWSGWRRRSRPWTARADSRPFLQLVRHARPASARPAICVLGRQRESRRAPDRAGQRVSRVDATVPRAGRSVFTVSTTPWNCARRSRRCETCAERPGHAPRGDSDRWSSARSRSAGGDRRDRRSSSAAVRLSEQATTAGRFGRRRSSNAHDDAEADLQFGSGRAQRLPGRAMRRDLRVERACAGLADRGCRRSRMAHGRWPTHGLRLSVRPRPPAAVDRLSRRGRHARSQLLRPARVGSAAGELRRHRQGRRADPALVPPRPMPSRRSASGAALISWSGSMFEYLMPTLVMRAPAGSLLEQTNRLIVRRQIEYGADAGLPWGISESAYNARDLELTYQYSNFGVPGLGLKRGLARERRGRALRHGAGRDDRSAGRRAQFRASGGHRRARPLRLLRGARLHAAAPAGGREVAVVRAYMAHHQGMTIVAIAERAPRRRDARALSRRADRPGDGTPAAGTHAARCVWRSIRGARGSATRPRRSASSAPRRRAACSAPHECHAAHASALQRPLFRDDDGAPDPGTAAGATSAVTRWREDATCDGWGTYIFLRDVDSGAVWSAGLPAERGRAGQLRGHVHRGPRRVHPRATARITTTPGGLVSPEDDAEVRRLSISNNGDELARSR